MRRAAALVAGALALVVGACAKRAPPDPRDELIWQRSFVCACETVPCVASAERAIARWLAEHEELRGEVAPILATIEWCMTTIRPHLRPGPEPLLERP